MSTLPCDCIPANVIADSLGISPSYKQLDSARWNSAAHLYYDGIDMTMNHHKNFTRQKSRSQCHSPEPPKFPRGRRRSEAIGGSLLALQIDCVKMGKADPIPCIRCGNPGSPTGSIPMSLQKVSSINRSFAGTNPASRGESSLELEAIAAVHELSFAVQSISVSEMLPRTSDLIFVNVTTMEGSPYCLELTLKGWRITSLRLDCMIGDFTRLEVFTKYYDSLYALMETISPGYRDLLGEKVAQRLRLLQMEDDDTVAPCGSYISPPFSRGSSCRDSRASSRESASSRTSFSYGDSLPVITPTSTPAPMDTLYERPLGTTS